MTDYLLTGISVGAGDPDLITLKALKTLQQAQLIFTLQNQETGVSVALDAALPHINKETQQIITIDIPRGRRAGEQTDIWRMVANTIADNMANYAKQSDEDKINAGYLLLGDGSLYGTFNYVCDPLAEHHPHIKPQMVAGVSAYAVAAAETLFPLSSVDERVCVLPATYETLDSIERLIADFDTIILLKAGRVRSDILALLEKLNLLDSAIYAERLGLPDERIVRDVRALNRNEQGAYLSLFLVRKK